MQLFGAMALPTLQSPVNHRMVRGIFPIEGENLLTCVGKVQEPNFNKRELSVLERESKIS